MTAWLANALVIAAGLFVILVIVPLLVRLMSRLMLDSMSFVPAVAVGNGKAGPDATGPGVDCPTCGAHFEEAHRAWLEGHMSASHDPDPTNPWEGDGLEKARW